MLRLPKYVMYAAICLVVLLTAFTVNGQSQPPPKSLPYVYLVVMDDHYHRSSCPEIKSKTTQKVTLDAGVIAWSPCPICHPEDADDVVAFLNRAGAGPEQLRLRGNDAKTAVARAITAAREAEALEATNARHEADAELAKRAIMPLNHPTLAKLLALANAASSTADGDKAKFVSNFRERVQVINDDYEGDPIIAGGRDGEYLVIWGPVAYFQLDAAERVRKLQPLTGLTLRSSVEISMDPEKIDSPDIERIVVKRNGVIVPPISSTLKPKVFTTRMGAKTVLHAGSVFYPLSAFAPALGATVTVIGIAASGDNFTRTFSGIELRKIY